MSGLLLSAFRFLFSGRAMGRGRDRIVAAFRERMAAQDAFCGQIKRFQEGMGLEALAGVLGAGWVVPAGAFRDLKETFQRGKYHLIAADYRQSNARQDSVYGLYHRLVG